MTSLPQVQSLRAPVTPESPFSMPWLAQLRRGLGVTAGRPVLMAGCQATPEQGRQIGEAIARLTASLQPRPDDIRTKAIAVTRLLSAFPRQAGEQDLRADAYFEALEGIPPWAVERAVGRVIRGEAGLDHRFAPSPPQLAVEARKATQPLKDDLAVLQRLRDAVADQPVSDEERARVAAGFDALAGSLSGRAKAAEAASEGMARDALAARCDELGIDRAKIDALPDAPPRSLGSWEKPRHPQPQRSHG